MPATLTSFGTKLVVADWKDRGLDANHLLGREEVTDSYFSMKRGYAIKKKRRPYIEDVHYEEPFVTESYHGGRNEQFVFGPADEGQWRDHDLSSAYTTAMSLIGVADWKRTRRIDSFQGVDPLDLAYFSVDFIFPEHVRFPTLPVRTANGIIFPRNGNSKCASPELALAYRLGADIRIKRGLLVPSDRSQSIFGGFIQNCIHNRNRYEKGTFDNQFWKEVGNSTYGKTAQGLREKRVYDIQGDDMVNLPESEITQPYFASFITSYTRAVLGEVLNGFSKAVCVFSVTTDGFLSNADDDEIQRATSGPLFRSFADARNRLDPNGSALEVKHTVRQPIGWRTRGSATLKKGDGKAGIVLQKGGIKSKELYTDDQENSYVVNLFLGRNPSSKIEYKSGISIRQMVQIGADFVFRQVSKRLSMEFDWKRSPTNARDVQFEFEGRDRQHLAFDTKPLENVREFNEIRDAWERFNKNPYRNLKSLRDLEAFGLYRRTSSDPQKDAMKYLKREDGDLKRLRRDLTRAFKRHQAGFDVERKSRRVTHEQFCDVLNACGIPCKTTDIENANRVEFKPHQTVGTDRVLEALRMLKRRYYPALEIELFLTEKPETDSRLSELSFAA